MSPERESPLKLARRIRQTLPGQRGVRFGHRPDTTAAYLRMAQALVPGMVARLEQAAAPTHVVRWVAWGRDLPERILRLALALYLRRPADPRHPSRSATGMCWLKDARQGLAQEVFLESPEGGPTVAWLRDRYTASEYEGLGGHTPGFWAEVDRRVRSIPLDVYWEEIDLRVATKPKRRAPKGVRSRTPARPGALTAEQRGALRVVGRLLAEHGLLDAAQVIIREPAKTEEGGA